MGRLVIQNSGLSVELLLAMPSLMDLEYGSATVEQARKCKLIMCGNAFVVLFSVALRGGEVLLSGASELVRRITEGKYHVNHPHIPFPLMGCFKGETGEPNFFLSS